MEGKCYCCGKAGHKSPACRFRNKPKEEWAINKSQQSHVQTQPSSEASVVINNTSVATSSHGNQPTAEAGTETPGWAGTHVHCQFYQADEMKDWILLDNQSTTTIFCNKDLVSDIRDVDDSMNLYTNGGVLHTTKKATIPQWGEAWLNEDAITNIFSAAEMAAKHRVTYDSEKEDAYIVHLPNKQVKFTKTSSGLYVFKPNIKKTGVQLLNTVAENKSFYTQRQFERAKRARDLYNSLGTPSIGDFKAILRMNAIKDNPVTTRDIIIAEKIFGPDIGALKGKTTRRKPAPVVDDYIEIPRELLINQQQVTLCLDVMKVNGVPFLTTISQNLYYRTAQWVQHQTSEVFKAALGSVFRVYNLGGFRVTQIRCDNEFRPLMDPLANEFAVAINYANPQEHVPEAERNNRVIKERVQATYHRLPYNHLPRLLIKTLIMELAKKLNFFPAKNGVSPYFSPRMILHQRTLDFPSITT